MAPSYDLATEKFLSVTATLPNASQQRYRVSLPDLLTRAHEIDDLHLPVPPAEAGLRRVLCLLVARITGLDDPTLKGDRWYVARDRVWAQGRFNEAAVRAYFDRWAGRFDLFHTDRPWLQDPRLAAQCDKSTGVNKLVLGRPAGQNPVWFAHHWDADPQPIPSAEAVWYLLAQLFYGPSGRCTARTVGVTREGNTTAGPLRAAASYHPVGTSLFESLVAGMYRPAEGDRTYPDLAPWEAAELPDPLGVPTVPAGFAALLGQFRHAVLLIPETTGQHVVDARITWAYRQPSMPLHDPYLIYQRSKQGDVYARQADADRAIFRDVDALLCKTVDERNAERPQVLTDLQQADRPIAHLRIRMLGFDQDRQTRDSQWFTHTTPPVLGLIEERDPSAAHAIGVWGKAAELAGRNLAWALRRTWVAVNDPSNGDGRPVRKDVDGGPWVARAHAHYWASAERIFWNLFDQADYTVGDLEFFRAGLDAFDWITATPLPQPRLERAKGRFRGLIFTGRTPARSR